MYQHPRASDRNNLVREAVVAESDSKLVVVSRKEAIAKGLRYYFTGKACKHGHVSRRVLRCGTCVQCKNKAISQWQKNNRAKVTQKARRWRKNNPERTREIWRKWEGENRDKRPLQPSRASPAAKQKRKKRIAGWREQNRERVNGYTRKFRKNNFEVVSARERVYANKRRMQKLGNGGSHTAEDINEIRALQHYKCAYCPASVERKYHVDHIIPLSAGGRNDRSNLQILCRCCNLSKSKRDPIEFAQSRGMLL